MANFLTTDAPLRDKLAQLMFVRVGSNLPPVKKVEDDAERIERLLEDIPLGGLILFNGDWEKTPATLERLQTQSAVPLLITADLERGAGQQLHGLPVYPHAMAFQAAGDEAVEQVEQFARVTAEAMRSAGVHLNFAPVADVHSEPRNPIIGTRAFASHPERAAKLAAAFVRAAAAGGVLSAAKHFPGHGNTQDDSHHAIATVSATKEELAACEFVPFRAAIEAGVPLVMSAHVCYPELDPTNMPATLSKPILQQLLREELGFAGAVVSDSLLMEGVTRYAASEGELARMALLAGVDILLDVADPRATLESLVRDVEAGRLAESRIDEALARLEQLKQTAIGDRTGGADDLADRTEQYALAAARRAVTFASSDQANRLDPAQPVAAVLIKSFTTHLDPPEQPLAAALRERFASVDYHELSPESEPEQVAAAIEAARRSTQRLVAMIVKPAAWHAFGLSPVEREWVANLIQAGPPTLACLGPPEGLEGFQAAEVLWTYSDVPASQSALAEAISKKGSGLFS